MAAFVFFGALILAPFFIARRLRQHHQAPGMARHSLATAVAVLLLLLAFGPFARLDGLFERLATTVALLWQVALAALVFVQASRWKRIR